MNQTFFYNDFPTSYNFPRLNELFGAQAQLDIENIPDNMNDFVKQSHQLYLNKAKICVKYAFYTLEEICNEKIIFSYNNSENKNSVLFADRQENHNMTDCSYPLSLNGTLLPKIFKDCHSIMLYVLTVCNYDKIYEMCDDDIMLSFFADAWGSAYAECADSYFIEKLAEEFHQKQVYVTNSHNPGQHLFPLENQKIIFELLQPDNIGLTLTDSCLMMPSKSISGIIGLSNIPQDISKVSCDYCNLRDTCPTAYIQTKNNKL